MILEHVFVLARGTQELSGAHVNVLADAALPPELAAVEVTPQEPVCRFAAPLAEGVTEHFLVFPDMESARAALLDAGLNLEEM